MTMLEPVSQQIWDMKYRFKSPDGTPLDESLEASWRRVAKAAAAVEAEPEVWEERFYQALDGFKFLPAGRILAGAGTGRSVTLFNCFVMGAIPDDMGGIFDHLREAALTMQQGGGIGYDFSTLRPRGAAVHGVGADASGPLSFMDVWDAMCRTIMSAGSRRGAMMATLRCDHPDIEAFITAKREPNRLRMFNLSVLVTDRFMQAVERGEPWPLVFGGRTYRTIQAAELWDAIMQATYDYAEPGVIFIDRINEQNNILYCETIFATNPCGEQPLPPYGACLLGSLNLAVLVERAFSDTAAIDLLALGRLVPIAVRLLDNVIEISRFPLEAQRAEAQAKRRVGLGITGLADALIMCGARYGSERAIELTETWLAAIRSAAYRASAELAAERGAFPLYASAYLERPNIRALEADVQALIGRHGIRNALLTSIAPTGTISLLANNVSSGLEPVFSFRSNRNILLADGTRQQVEVTDYAHTLFRRLHGGSAPLPDAFVDTAILTPEDHLRMQAAAQKFVDSSISKTINVPKDTSFDTFKGVYAEAYALGCKGCTTYRPNEITGAVLSAAAEVPAADSETLLPGGPPLSRPDALPGQTYKLRWPESDHATYITVNDIMDDGMRRPFEVFINSKNMDHYAWTVGLTRMISAVFRRGGDVGFVVEELKAVFDPRGGAWLGGRYVPSLLAAIGDIIERHMIIIGFLPSRIDATHDERREAFALTGHGESRTKFGQCPRCGTAALVHQEGCVECLNCGFSKCG
jgi:ribonucleoside-diphosphate reductase alpha chain